MVNSSLGSEEYGRYVVNAYLQDKLLSQNNGFKTITFTQDPYDPVDILYTTVKDKKIAVEVKVRGKFYKDFIYEQSKAAGLEKYKEEGYQLVYANVVEENQRIYFWNVTDISKIGGAYKSYCPCPSSSYAANPYIKDKCVYNLPVSSTFLQDDISAYLDRYNQLKSLPNPAKMS